MVFKMLQSSVAKGGRYCNGAKMLHYNEFWLQLNDSITTKFTFVAFYTNYCYIYVVLH
jgi:hypothetical protein